MFRSSVEKSCNLEIIIERLKKIIIKKDNKINPKKLDELVNIITNYYINTFENIPNNLYKDDNKDLIDLAKEDQTLLLEWFNMNKLYEELRNTSDYETKRFEKFYDFRRQVMRIVLYQTIEKNGKGKGAEYGLIFAKAFNFDLSIPMHYASYDGMFDERFLKFYDTYLGIGGSPYTYWLPNYFDGNDKSKYNMEDLSELTPQLRTYINKYKVNSKK